MIPQELRSVNRWIAFKEVIEEDRRQKKPICCIDGTLASVDDANSWTDYRTAVDFAKCHLLDGIGIALVLDDDLVIVDLDECRDPISGQINSLALQTVERFNSYTEVSYSGTGLHILIRGTIPRNRNGQNVEIYAKNKFFLITGNQLPGTIAEVRECSAQLNAFYDEMFTCGNVSISDDQVIHRAEFAIDGDKFRRLMLGDTQDYKSPSEADFQLCRMLAAWVGDDPVKIEQLFEKSDLSKRDKWCQRSDYRTDTIANAIKSALAAKQQQPLQRPDNVYTADVPPLTDDEVDLSIRLALTVFDKKGHEPLWQASFNVIRAVQTISRFGSYRFEAAAKAYCQASGLPFDDFYAEFHFRWNKPKLTDAENAFEIAAEKARQWPYHPKPLLGELYAKVASIAWWLSVGAQHGEFFLSQPKIAKILGVHNKQISRQIGNLQNYEILECTDDDYSFTGKKRAKCYRFTGVHQNVQNTQEYPGIPRNTQECPGMNSSTHRTPS
jgi:putative DNA primase/helicase